MGLVNELQESAERDDVTTVLRKAKRLSSKLARADISEWLGHEQSGYPRGDAVPEYRIIQCGLCYNTNGYIPAGFGMLQKGVHPLAQFDRELDLKVPQVDSVSGILSHIAAFTGGNGLFIPAGDEISRFIRSRLECSIPQVLNRLTFLVQLNEAQIRDIPEQVKNKVLDWACKLEAAGVTGDGMSFTALERQIAQNVIFNISHSSVEQITNGGINLKGRTDG